MKILTSALLLFVLTSCASTMSRHRMNAAQRKLLETQRLQQSGAWEEALAMAERMHASVAKSVADVPMGKIAGGTQADLRPLLIAWEQGPYRALTSALRQQDASRSTPAFAALRQQCANCHAVAGRTDVQLAALPLR